MTTKDPKKKRDTKSKEAKREEALASLQNDFLHKPAVKTPGETVITISPAILKGREGSTHEVEEPVVTPGQPLFSEKTGQSVVKERAMYAAKVKAAQQQQPKVEPESVKPTESEIRPPQEKPVFPQKSEEPPIKRILDVPNRSLMPGGSGITSRPDNTPSSAKLAEPPTTQPVSQSKDASSTEGEPSKSKTSSSLFAFLDLGSGKSAEDESSSQTTEATSSKVEKPKEEPKEEPSQASTSPAVEVEKKIEEERKEQGVFKKARSFLATLTKKNKDSSD